MNAGPKTDSNPLTAHLGCVAALFALIVSVVSLPASGHSDEALEAVAASGGYVDDDALFLIPTPPPSKAVVVERSESETPSKKALSTRRPAFEAPPSRVFTFHPPKARPLSARLLARQLDSRAPPLRLM